MKEGCRNTKNSSQKIAKKNYLIVGLTGERHLCYNGDMRKHRDAKKREKESQCISTLETDALHRECELKSHHFSRHPFLKELCGRVLAGMIIAIIVLLLRRFGL